MSFDLRRFDIALINPFDLKGGASIGTFKLFLGLLRSSKLRSCLLVIDKQSHEILFVYGANRIFKYFFYCQALVNKFLCFSFSPRQPLPVAFTFLTPISLPAIAISIKSWWSRKIYLHSMGSGFSCPISFDLLVRRASVIKTADDWYLTGGCHYSLDCNQWTTGCYACPRVNSFGRIIVRFNWHIKRFALNRFRGTFVSPSTWLSSRYSYVYGKRCKVIHNAATKVIASASDSTPKSSLSCHSFDISMKIKDFKLHESGLVLGLPVTYLRDSRKGFLKALPVLRRLLNGSSLRIVLCGGDSDDYKDMLLDSEFCTNIDNDSVLSFGNLGVEDMVVFYKQLDFILHFAEFDNSPNVITEALGLGVPAIVLNNAGSPEHILASGAGYVLPNINSLPEKISMLLLNRFIVQDLKDKAIAYASSYLSEAKMINSYLELLS